MRLIEHFCDPKQAEKLQWRGLRQDGHFYYMNGQGPFAGSATSPGGDYKIRAFNLVELLAIIPPEIYIEGDAAYKLIQYKACVNNEGRLSCAYSFEYLRYEGKNTHIAFRFMSQSAAAAAAEIVITLLETKILEFNEANVALGESH